MKIAFFHPYFAMGGVEKTNIRIAEYLIKKGHSVDFISLSFTEHFKEEIDELGICCITLKAKRAVMAIAELRRYMEQYSVVISCQNYANLIAILAKRGCPASTKLIVSERLHPDEFLYNGKQKKGKIILSLMRLLYRKADVVLANSKETAEAVSKITGCKVRCIYNPTLTGDYEGKANEPVEHPWFREDVPIIISVGRLAKEKGFDTLIKAFAKVNTKLDCRLVLVGDGEEKENLINLAKKLQVHEKIWMAGYDKNPYKYVKKASVFVLSSRFEGLPNTLIEALAVGAPCVATDCRSGPKEILLDGEGGILVKTDDNLEMADAILRVLQNPEQAKCMLEKAMSKLYRFTPDEVGKQYERILLDSVYGKCGDHQGNDK
ncbi:MAG: glycosyltransferase [Lachnospiraceae bacterium]